MIGLGSDNNVFIIHFLTFPRKQDTCKSNAAIESSGFPLGRHALKKV